MRKIIFRLFLWYHWKNFNQKIKKIVGYKSLDTLNYDLNNLEKEIRNDNEIPVDQKITWDNSKKTDKNKFALYFTLFKFSQEGEFLKQATKLYNNSY